jgi:transposase
MYGALELIPGGSFAPSLRPRQVVMGNPSAYKGMRIREFVEARCCELLYLPRYSPEVSSMAQVFSKVKGLRRRAGTCTRDAFVEAIGQAFCAGTPPRRPRLFDHLRLLSNASTAMTRAVVLKNHSLGGCAGLSYEITMSPLTRGCKGKVDVYEQADLAAKFIERRC